MLARFVFKTTLFSSIPRRLRKVVLTRSIANTFGLFTLVNGQKFIPMGIFQVVFSSNLFTTALMGFCWLKETLTLFEILAMFSAFAGIVIIGLSSNVEEKPVETTLSQAYF